MPRAATRIPKLRLHKPSGRAVVTLSETDHYCGAFGTAEAQLKYAALLKEWLVGGRRPLQRVPIADEPTVADVVGLYIEARRRCCTPETIERAYKPAMKWLCDEAGAVKISRLHKVHLIRVQEHMAAGGASRGYCNKVSSAVRRFAKWAAKNDYIPIGIVHQLDVVGNVERGLARETDPVRPADPRLVEAVLPYVPAQVGAIVRLLELTGARVDEICRMRPCDLDMSDDPWAYRVADHKNAWRGQSRTIYLGPRCQEILAPWLAGRRTDAFLFSPAEAERARLDRRRRARRTPDSCGNSPGTNRRDEPKRRPGQRYTPGSVRVAIQRALARAFPHVIDGIPERERTAAQRTVLEEWRAAHHFTPGQLRHTFATNVRDAHGLERTAACLGHKRLETSTIYAERAEGTAREVMRLVG